MAGNPSGWLVVWLCFVILFVLSGVQAAFAVFIMPMSRELGGSVSELALAMTICMLVAGFSSPILGRVADKHGPRTVILVGAAVTGVSILLLAFVSSVWQVYLLYGCILGFTCFASGTIATTALVSRWFIERRSVALTVFQSGFPLGWLCIVPLAERLIISYGWRNSWLVLGIVLLFVGLIAASLLKEPDRAGRNTSFDRASRPIPLGTAMKTSSFLMLGVVIQFICGFTDVPFTTLWVPMSLEWGMGEVAASYTLGFIAALVFLGGIVIGPLPERLGKKISLTIIYAVRAVSLIIPVVMVKSATVYYAFAVLFAFSFFGMMPVISVWLGETFGERSVGSLLGLSFLMHSIGSGAGIYLFGLWAERYGSYYLAFLSSSILVLVSVMCCILIRPARTRP